MRRPVTHCLSDISAYTLDGFQLRTQTQPLSSYFPLKFSVEFP